MGKATGTAEEGLPECPEVPSVEVVNLYPPVLTISDVQLGILPRSSIDVHRVVGRRIGSAPFLAGEPCHFVAVLVEPVHHAGAVAVGDPDVASSPEPLLVNSASARAVRPHQALRRIRLDRRNGQLESDDAVQGHLDHARRIVAAVDSLAEERGPLLISAVSNGFEDEARIADPQIILPIFGRG